MKVEDMVFFLDNIGRSIIGEKVVSRCTSTDLVVKNPLIIHVNIQGNQMGVQFFPFVFKDFLADKTDDTVFTFKTSNLTVSDKFVFDMRLLGQYENIFTKVPAPMENVGTIPLTNEQSNRTANASLIKLFDE